MNKEEALSLAAEAENKAKEAEINSEYPRVGKYVYTELSNALKGLAATIEENSTEKGIKSNSYEERKQAKIERLKIRAAKKRVEAAEAEVNSHNIGSRIPLGQPILVGHHSERGHRNAIAKMHKASSKAYETNAYADELERRAEAAENNTAISSDDPEACIKLKEKIEDLTKRRELMKAANKLILKNDKEGVIALGFSEQKTHELFNPQFEYYGKGFRPWQLTNLGAEIRRLKKRLEQLSKVPSENHIVSVTTKDFEVFEDKDENRICFKFPGKPSEEVRKLLKSSAFKWSPTRLLWVRQLSDNARYSARVIVKQLTKTP